MLKYITITYNYDNNAGENIFYKRGERQISNDNT